MDFLKCIFCDSSRVKIFSIAANGMVKSKCYHCGLNSDNEEFRKVKINKPEVIYK